MTGSTPPLTADELREKLRALGLRQKQFAQNLGVAPNTVYRWTMGNVPVPQYAAYCVSLLEQLSRSTSRRGRRT